MAILSFMIMVGYILVPSLKFSIAIDSINMFQSMSDGQTLVSKGGKFELGLFSPNNSTKRYLGIWYKNIPIQTVVWVANGANPINNSFGILTLNSTGNLMLTQNGSIVWSTDSKKQAQNPVATLFHTGNLVVGNEGETNPEAYLWQSFDYPSDTFLPGMKLGWDLRIGLERKITSWRSPNDPSPGDFHRTLALNSYPEFYLMNRTQKFFRFAPWNGLYVSGTIYPRITHSSYTKFVSNKNELFYTYIITNDSILARGVINQTSYSYDRLYWDDSAQTWERTSTFPADICDTYDLCGAYANCIPTESPPCLCLEGFSPKSPQAWNSSDWNEGCVRDKPLHCKDKHSDQFVKYERLKPPDTSHTWLDENIGLEECNDKCLNNCSCKAYANSDIREGGSGCVLWFGDLIDIRQFLADEIDIYIRMSASEIGKDYIFVSNKTIIVTTVAITCGILLLCIYFICRVRKSITERSKTEDNNERHVDELDLSLFDLQTIKTATMNFLIKNKIGEGGFGPVYWGKLADGQEIAVKRLSRSSGQGMTEFKNEVKLIAKLQHRNLVKLLGCCIHGQEKLLVYEFMPNGSLDSFIYDHTKGKLLHWSHRFHIIFGIARGLLYLHQDSRLRIIHRDLKASNVLLDDKLNPKISDFGIAKAVGGDETEGNTNRVAGTYGYMAPEYAVDGLFSIKSDVFSFGILLLEIICGKKNRALCYANHTFNLVGYAWTLWKEGMVSQLIDPSIKQSCIVSEALRCIHVGLLCVQQYPKDRPTMTSVVQMLGSEMEIVEPKEPGFYLNVSNETNLPLNPIGVNSYVELTDVTLDGSTSGEDNWEQIESYSYENCRTLETRDVLSNSVKYSNEKYPKSWNSMDILCFMFMVAGLLVPSSIAIDSISVSQFITDDKTLVSQGGIFELGFFSPGSSNKRYLGIWYKNIPDKKVVWVANREIPINGSSGMLRVNSTGNLVLSQNGSVVWHTKSQKQGKNPMMVLLDSGNLVVKNEGEKNPEDYLWQSFDYLSDTVLQEMKLGWNLKLGIDWRLTSWKSPDDPSRGDLSWALVLNDYPEYYMMKGTEKIFRIGPWNGQYFSGTPGLQPNPIFNFKYVTTKDEIFYSYTLTKKSVISVAVLNQTTSKFYRYVWVEGDQNWRTLNSIPTDTCDTYGLCGVYANCMVTQVQVCQCLKGFSPKSPKAWNSTEWTQGCDRNKPLSCKDKLTDGFVKYEAVKVPDTTHTWVDETMGLDECRFKCLNNCSCMAYTNTNIRGTGSGCVMWLGDLIDIRQYERGGQDLYIRMPASELGSDPLEPVYSRHKKNTATVVVSTLTVIFGALLLGAYFIRRIRRNMAENSVTVTEDKNERHVDDLDIPLFDLPTISAATDDFSMKNKIGEGGFGPVYKGILTDGQEIAVKTLSRSSRQGLTEFLNEVKVIAKLQHRNLVRLLGCCIQGQETILVYEYMANGSLDSFIFDDTKSKLLEWPQRFHIICGIARGLMYLHQDSRLRIIHRDLKASNVLLDENLSPKISDFGMAKTFGGDQVEGNTRRVVGTYGYMAPEYAVDGLFSVKSDVFSFGILLLEILCGKRNRGIYHTDKSLNLVYQAWTSWKEGRALELIESNVTESCNMSEALRCLHVSLLCVQQYPEDRPTMASVILMLESQMELVEPKEHGFISRKASVDADLRSNLKDTSSTNEVTITLLEAR
ncbi:uncharacterized protein LOC113865077 [Abrus precatorius]|uniref:non-specific serine/threonine protein kinase n=1 Tax=Abrus precatorius TaxID=3816 RepID=A0A8B8LFV5_ABRPR|nr:uncharacterized protein LOC113865077 [Abrus precatorius]